MAARTASFFASFSENAILIDNLTTSRQTSEMCCQSLQSMTPSAEIQKRASDSGKHGEHMTLHILSSARPFRK